MQKYIIRRLVSRVEKREIEVSDYSEAILALKSFKDEPTDENHVAMHGEGTVEYIGDS